MSDELDLEHGDEERAQKLADEAADKEASSAGKSRRSSTQSKARPTPRSRAASNKADTEILDRLDRVFSGIASALANRGDDELAQIIEGDKASMSGGIVSLTRNVKPLRGPAVIILNLVEPLLAFGRIGGVLFRRWVARRERMQAEWEYQQQQAANAPVVDAEVVS